MNIKDFEIMAPVGSRESLAAAIQAGADSIYFGIENPVSYTHLFELPKIDVAPRTRIFGAVPNVPETFCTDTPCLLYTSIGYRLIICLSELITRCKKIY